MILFIDDILIEINKKNLESVFAIMIDFEEIGKVLRRLMQSRLPLDFQRYRSVLLDLKNSYEIMQSEFRVKIQKLLPRLRAKKAEAEELTNLIAEYKNDPYEKEKFLALLNTRQKEIETAEFIIYNEELIGHKVNSRKHLIKVIFTFIQPHDVLLLGIALHCLLNLI